jgi:hypothetical protein
MNTLSKSFNEEPNWSVPQPLAIVPSSWQVSVCAAAAQGRGRGGDEAGAAGERTNTDRLRQKYNLSPRIGGQPEQCSKTLPQGTTATVFETVIVAKYVEPCYRYSK